MSAVAGKAPALRHTSLNPGTSGIVRVLLLLQGGFALLSVLEVVFMGLVSGTLPVLVPVAAITGVLAIATLWLAAGLRSGSRRGRRLTFAIEGFVLLGGLADLGLSLAFSHAFLDPVPAVTRLLIPTAIIVILRRPAARCAFHHAEVLP
jgi:hypothetical protein